MIESNIRGGFFKKYLIIFMVLISIITIVSGIFIDSEVKKIQKDELVRYANIIGILKENNIDEDIIRNIIKPGENETNIKEGLDILNNYAYNEEISIENNKWFGKSYEDFKIRVQILNVISMMIVMSILVFLIYIIIKKVNKLSIGIKKLSEGEHPDKLEENKEGIFAIAYHRFNILSFRMRS